MRSKRRDWSDFEVFTDVGAKKAGEAFITLAKHGVATLNTVFMAENPQEMKGKTHVKLAYSKSNNCIGLQFTNDKSDPSSIVKLTKDEKKGNCSFTIRSFALRNNLDLDKIAGRYSLEVERIPKRGEYFIINIEENSKGSS